MLKNKKGIGGIFLIGLIAIGCMITSATVETAQNGVLKKNGKLIWCKMQNKGNTYCDAQYQ